MPLIRVLSLVAFMLATTACSPPTPSDDALGDFVPPTLAKRDEVRQLLEKRFDERDVDGDGRLTTVELGSIRADRISKADTDQDGAISRTEFVAHGLERFDRTDTNHDGMVTNKEQDAARATKKVATTPAQ